MVSFELPVDPPGCSVFSRCGVCEACDIRGAREAVRSARQYRGFLVGVRLVLADEEGIEYRIDDANFYPVKHGEKRCGEGGAFNQANKLSAQLGRALRAVKLVVAATGDQREIVGVSGLLRSGQLPLTLGPCSSCCDFMDGHPFVDDSMRVVTAAYDRDIYEEYSYGTFKERQIGHEPPVTSAISVGATALPHELLPLAVAS